MAHHMMEKAREAGARWAGQNVLTRTISQHPIPFAVAGAGVGFLIWRGLRANGRAPLETAEEKMEAAAGEKAEGLMEQARSRSGEWIGRARDKAGEVYEQARGKAGSLGATAQEKTRVLREKSRTAPREQPLVMAAAAFAVGAVLGFALPETMRERMWLGEVREFLISQAKEYVRQRVQFS